MAQNTVLGLDIGSANIKAIVAEARGDKMKVIAGFTRVSSGLRRGSVVEMDEVCKSVAEVLNEVKVISRSSVKNIFLNIGSVDVKSQISRGIVAVARANSEIHEDDIERVVKASQAINIPQNRTILHTITKEYVVDGVNDIRDPEGMIGARLEVSSMIIDAFAPALKNLQKCVEISGGSISGLVFNPLAAARSVLTKNQKELGVVLIDIGFGTTSLVIYEEDKILHTAIFPVGAGHITNDLAIALKIPVETAEKLKLAYGYALSKEVSSRDTIDLKKIDLTVTGSPSRKFIAEVIESRIQEIFELVNNELRLIGKSGRLPAGAVLCGGGAKMPGIVDLSRQELKLSTQIGLPQASYFELSTNELAEYLELPEWAVPLGLVLCSKDQGRVKSKPSGSLIVKIFQNLLPE
ncbi:MAG TPA: cell division protein FtsA [Candidatus Colwellbacteria bacterium]|jgi:cell division protein FtsA|nr:cell division protein FtsA [Candidatus Colwellbacteria bacterium]